MIEDSHVETRIVEYDRRKTRTETGRGTGSLLGGCLDRHPHRRIVDGLFLL